MQIQLMLKFRSLISCCRKIILEKIEFFNFFFLKGFSLLIAQVKPITLSKIQKEFYYYFKQKNGYSQIEWKKFILKILFHSHCNPSSKGIFFFPDRSLILAWESSSFFCLRCKLFYFIGQKGYKKYDLRFKISLLKKLFNDLFGLKNN